MPKVRVNGAELHYEEFGSGAETIVFSHGLLMSGRMFEKQVEALKGRYRCIAYDHRGQGQSEVTASGYDMETLYEDASALITALNAAPCHFVGLSMGGFMGLRLAARRPHLLKSLILMETSADPEPDENVPRYRMLNTIARWFGLGLVAGRVMPIMFGQKFIHDSTRAAERELWKRRIIGNHRIGITRAVTGVITRSGVYDELDKITVPTLIIVGDQDVATVPAKSERMQARIAGSKLVVIPGAGHSSSIEEPAAVNAAISAFLDELAR
ncbi:MAG: alpha/beta fold hydrolase [Chloroflexi bacterium]|nr:alpha/beta fold hydrolase [Chloroflexota bacterium]